MNKVSIDFGGSTIDLATFEENGNVQRTYSFEADEIERGNILGILKKAEIDFNSIKRLKVTGGFSLNLPKKINGLTLEKVPEFDANGMGGQFLAKTKNCLVVSIGTGTSMVKVIDGKIEHIGGTGVGGGMLIGLGKLLLNEIDHHKIDELAKQGNIKNVDLSVQDIVGGKIGILPSNATASNFGKCSLSGVEGKSSKADLALGICNLIGETIASVAYFASEKYDLEKIVLIGKVTRIQTILKIIQTTSKIYNKKIIIPKNADFGTAIGAGILNS